jgi:hypothetical protein
MTTAHILLALACVALLLVIAVQDWLVIPLRNNTISSGLTGPYHALLDAAYVPLAAFLALRFVSQGPVMEGLALISGTSLLLVAATNTAWRWFNAMTDGKHSLWHTRFTLVVFASAFALQLVGDFRRPLLSALTVLTIVPPLIAYVYFETPVVIKGVTIAASPAAEKLYVLGLCLWLIFY